MLAADPSATRRRPKTAICVGALLLLAGPALAETLSFETAAEWRRWTAPHGLVQIPPQGGLRLVKFRKGINAVADAPLFSHKTRTRGDSVSGGVWEAGAGRALAGRVIDGDPATFWRPEPDALLKDWFVQIDLGRAVLARQIRLTFPDREGARPFRQFTVFIATGITSDPLDDLFIFEPVYSTTRPNTAGSVTIPLRFAADDTARVLDTGLKVERPDDFRLVQFINFTVEAVQPDGALAEIEVEAIGDNISLGTPRRGLVLDGLTSRGNAGLFDADLNTTSTIEPVSFEGREDTWQSQGTFFFADLGAVFWLDELFFYVMRQQEGSIGNQAGPSRAYRVLFSDGTPSFSSDLPLPVKSDFDELLMLEPPPLGLRYMRFFFKPRRVRYLFWHPLSPKSWSSRWGELMLFSPGYPAEVVLRSDFIDLGQRAGDGRPKVIGRLRWDAEVPPGTQLKLRSRAGNTLDRIISFYHRNGTQITQAAHNSLPRVLRGRVDTAVVVSDDWDEWSPAYRRSGEAFKSQSPRRLMQLELVLSTDDPQVAPSVRSLAVDFEDALLQSAQGRIAPSVARPNDETRFTYTLTPQGSAQEAGFDLLRFGVPAPARDVTVRLNGQAVQPLAAENVGDSLLIRLPTAVVDDTVEVDLTTRVLRNATVFGLDLGLSQRPGLWQSVEAAARNADIVLLPGLADSRRLIDDLRLSSPVLTPNGDGVHDRLQIRFVAFKVEGGAPQVRVFDLAGRPVVALRPQAGDGVEQVFEWSGRDGQGRLAAPGIYLYRIELGAQAGEDVAVGLISVAY